MTREELHGLSQKGLRLSRYLPQGGPRRSFTIEEVREILRISRATVYALINTNVLHVFKIGRLTRVTGESLDALMAGEREEVSVESLDPLLFDEAQAAQPSEPLTPRPRKRRATPVRRRYSSLRPPSSDLVEDRS
jgi:excisionase family DNA binding protein